MATSTARGSVFDAESFINEHYDAWSGTDLDLILSYYADNVVFQIPGLLMEGKAALRDQFVRPFIAAFPGNRHVVKSILFGPGVVAVEFSFEAQHKGPFGGHAATGAQIKLPGCGFYEYDATNRQIAAGRVYFDGATLLQTIVNSLVDDRTSAEEIFRTDGRQLRPIPNVIPTFIGVMRTDGSVLYVNQPVLGYTGLTLDEMRNEDYRDRVLHPEDMERLRQERRDALKRPVSFENEHRMLGKDGKYRWFLVRYNPLLDEQGRLDRWYVAAFDIEDRKQAEAQVEQASLRLAEAQRLSKTGTFVTDLLADDHDWSEDALRIFEFDPDIKVTTKTIQDRVHPEDLSSFNALLAPDFAATDVDFVFRILTPHGAVKHVRGMVLVTEQVAGRPLLIGALQDITENKAAEEALNRARTENKFAEEALNRARSELTQMARVTTLSALAASIAHEINQPLSGIITNAGTCLRMLDGTIPNIDGARETARRTIRDGNRASDVISRLRNLFSKKQFALEPVDLNEATREVIALSLTDLQRNRVILHSELAEELLPITGDRLQLQQVILNLLRNASDAMIDVHDRPRELLVKTAREDGDRVRVSIRDAGVGLSPQSLDSLFDAFFTTKIGGMGIGLYVSRSIIERHQGRLWAEINEKAPGATFSFSVPIHQGESEMEAATTAS